MSISFLAAAVATLAAAIGTGLLVRDCARLPRIELIPWLVAVAGLTLALAAQALGYYRGFGPTTFRAVQLGAQLLAPLALAWGLAEVAGRSVAARFAARLVLAGAAVIAGVILATDPLSSAAYSKAWPAASVHYQIIPNGVLLLVAGGTILVAVVAVLVAGVRSRRDPPWRDAFLITAAGGGAAVVLQVLRLALPVNAVYPAVCLLAAALAVFAGMRSDVRRLGLREEFAGGRGDYPEDDDGYAGLYRPGSGGYRRGRDDTGWGDYQPDTGGYNGLGADTGYGSYTDHGSRDVSDTGYGFYRQDDTGGLRALSDTGYGLYRDETGSMVFSDGPGANGVPGPETGFSLPALAGLGAEDEEEGTARLYGQIAIYTLLESRAEEFDRLAREVVAKVKAREPETLVYVMHGVPSAPMQRILYEVYRDQAAYEHHAEQAYVRDFEEQRKPYVLATNVIELGVRQAKVSPLGPDGQDFPGAPGGPAPARHRQPADPGRSRSQPDQPARPAAEPPSRSRPDASRSRPEPLPAEPPRSRPEPLPRLPAEPSRSRTEPPPRSRPGGEAEPQRSRRSSRSQPGDDGDFWSRPRADEPDDGDFWTRGGRYP